MLFIAFLHDGQNPIGVDRRAAFVFFICENVLIVNNHRIFFAEARFYFDQGCVETGMQFFRGIEHGCVG